MAKIQINKPYLPLYKSDNHNIICNTPRASGKSFETSQYCYFAKKKYSNHDIIVFRANANSLTASVINEIIEKFVMMGEGSKARIRQMPLRIEYDRGKSNIYFVGVSGHDKSRVRGFKPKNKLCLVLGDECQQITDEANLKHALATFKRYFDSDIDYKTVLCGNPHEIKGHWWNVYCQKHERAPDYESIKATYLDVWNVLNEEIKNEIELERQINPALYRFMYLGDLTDISGGAYPSFNRDKHLITQEQAGTEYAGETIDTVIFGGDGAITHDMTSLTCLAVMSSGRAVVLEPFIFDPISYGRALAPSEIAVFIERYMNDMERKYQFQRNYISVYMCIDCASADLIAQLRYQLDQYYTIMSFTTKNVIRNTSTANNVFAKNMVKIINYGGYFDYATNKWINKDIPLLSEQLESVVWKNNKLDPSIPNDVSDSFVYAVCTYYENPNNLNLPERNIEYE